MVAIDGSKVYLPDVRRIAWGSGEMCEFASALAAAMHYLGTPTWYDFIMGTSGAAFRFTFTADGWDFSDYGIRNISADPYEPVRRAIQALGFSYRICEKTTWKEDAAKIMNSIDQGIPVLAYPVVGPSDCCIITGYDEGGKVLLGWSTYQDIPDDHNVPPEASGYFRKPDWHANFTGCILLHAKEDTPPRRKIFLEAVQWGISLMRTPRNGARHTGLEGLKAWAHKLSDEKNFPHGDPQHISEFYLGTTIGITMLRDHCSAENFLRQAAEALPGEHDELRCAADCYHKMIQIRSGMDNVISDNFSAEAMAAIADPSKRLAFADAILQIRDTEQEAITHLERFIARNRLNDSHKDPIRITEG